MFKQAELTDVVIEEAKNHPLKFKTFSDYVKWFKNNIMTCGLSVNWSETLSVHQQGIPLTKPMHKGRGRIKAGIYYAIQIPNILDGDALGIIIENRLNLKLREVLVLIDRQLYLSSYAYHIELINEIRYPYFRYEKRPFCHEKEAYAPLFHVHVAGRLPHMPAPKVDVKSILENIEANLFDPKLAKRLSDGLWSELAQSLDKNSY